MPEIAFVIDIKGVCKAGATPHTEKYPVMTDRENILAIVKIAGLVQANPRPSKPINPVDRPRALFKDFWKLFGGSTTAFGVTYLGFDLAASSIGGLGLGHNSYFSLVTIEPLTTSSLKSIL